MIASSEHVGDWDLIVVLLLAMSLRWIVRRAVVPCAPDASPYLAFHVLDAPLTEKTPGNQMRKRYRIAGAEAATMARPVSANE